MASNQRVAVVTGSSSGIGHETSLTLARNGFLTYATMRSLNKGENTAEKIDVISKDVPCVETS
jgi:NAD(P)-dependent dehydrogenase (short-subunit alcohol dehydrogenase family)